MSVNKDKSLLKTIFSASKKDPNKLLPIITSSDQIPKILPFLTDTKIQPQEKITFISELTSLFTKNPNLIPCFMEKCSIKNSDLYEPLIKLYLNPSIPNDKLITIESILRLIISYITTPKLTLEYIYQRLSTYFTKETSSTDNSKDKLTENILNRYLKLFQFFYSKDPILNKNNNINKSNANNNDDDKKQQYISKYLYFNGINSNLTLNVNKTSINVNADFPTLEFGFTFLFWINIEKELVTDYFSINPSIAINLVSISIKKHQIKLIIDNKFQIKILIDGKEITGGYNLVSNNSKFKFDSWNSICFSMTQKVKLNQPTVKLYINDKNELISSNNISKDIPLNDPINSVKLFENLIGRVSCLLCFSFPIEVKLLDYFMTHYKYGFYKNKYLFNFLYLNDKEYFKNSPNYYFSQLYKKDLFALKFLNTSARYQNVKNLISFFCPFTFNKKEKIIDDIFGNFIGVPGVNDGVNYYINNSKSILRLGGIDNLLPIAELMYSSTMNNLLKEYPKIEKGILSEENFYAYLLVLEKILIGHHDNLNEAYNQKFFESLGLFLEKFPSNIFNDKTLEVLLNIGKETFQFSYDKINSANENFLNTILINEKILSKFNEKNQLILWENVNQFFTSDYSQMRDSLNMSKICLLLRFYDEKRYDEFCCKYHANVFCKKNSGGGGVIMNPEMNSKIGKLFDIIQLYIDKLFMDEEAVNLFKLLSLDLSPCLQKKIVGTYILHFTNEKISNENKLITLNNLLNNNYFDIIEYVLSISLLDVRIEIIKFLNIILRDHYSTIQTFISNNRLPTDINNIFEFIGDNLLPEQLVVGNDINISQDINKKSNLNANLNNNQNLNKNATQNTNQKENTNLNKNLNTNEKTSPNNIQKTIQNFNQNPKQNTSQKQTSNIKTNKNTNQKAIKNSNPNLIIKPTIIAVTIDKSNKKANTKSNTSKATTNINNDKNNTSSSNIITKSSKTSTNTSNKDSNNNSNSNIITTNTNTTSNNIIETVKSQANNTINNNNNSNQNKKRENMSKYFDRKIYEENMDSLWGLLEAWIYKQSNLNNPKSNKSGGAELDGLIIDFCICFSSKNIASHFINDFLLLIMNILKEKNIINLYLLYDNQKIYSWLIETIFYFHNKENTKETNQPNPCYEKIRTNSVGVFIELLSRTNNNNYIIKFILDFSYQLKKEFIKNTKQLNEIENITRMLLEVLLENKNLDMNNNVLYCYDFMTFYKKSNEFIGNYKPSAKKIDDNDIVSQNKKNTNKSNKNDLALELSSKTMTIAEINKITSQLSLNDNANNNSNFYEEKLEEELLSVNINFNELVINEEIIPECINDSINIYYDKTNKGISPSKRNCSLDKLWKDYNIYEKINSHYKKNFWGLEKLCRNVKAEYISNPTEMFSKLLKEYTETKTYKNILYKDVLKILNISENFGYNNNDIEEIITLNSLSVNLLLMIIAANLAKDPKDKSMIEFDLLQIIIYCILACLNINPSEKQYDLIQEKIYNILGLAFYASKIYYPSMYREAINHIITPIFEVINNEQKKKGLMKFLGIPRKVLFINTSVYKLFNYSDKSSLNDKLDLRSSTKLSNNNSSTNKNNSNNPMSERSHHKPKMYSEDLSVNINEEIGSNLIITFKGELLKILKNSFAIPIIVYRKKRIPPSENVEKGGAEKNMAGPFYKYSENKSGGVEDIINNTNERKRINRSIKKLMPFFESQIKKYSNTSFLKVKQRRNGYKNTKRKLFSWCGFWSNKYLFYEHPELLKYKKMNHLTREMTQLLLKPILDIEYYLPYFKKFDKKRLFNQKNYNYEINLDIDNIFINQEEEKKDIKTNISASSSTNNNINNNLNLKKNEYGFNYLECVYRYSYNDLWDKYNSYYEQSINFDEIGLVNKVSYDILVSNKSISKDPEKMKVENIYYCCMVKQTHHIRGYASTEEDCIIFMYESEENHTQEEIENDPGYDKDMGSCFGSIFKNHQKDKDLINFKIKYTDIKYMFTRIYFYNVSGVEIYTESNKCHFLTFKNNKDQMQFTNDILAHSDFREIRIDDSKNKTELGYERIKEGGNDIDKKKKPIPFYINSKYEEWQNYSISTFELLMWLNIYSGRSFNDLTQYPVFPWLITNYESDKLNEETDYRDLSLPMGMIGSSEKAEIRKETFSEIYESVKNDIADSHPTFNYQEYLKRGEDYYNNVYCAKKTKKDENPPEDPEIELLQPNQIPYYYGTHYSNPTYITHYLSRTFPYASIAIEIQGSKFDDPDRLFLSMKKTFESASTLKDDVRELIPEFFSLPEMFINMNNFDLAQGKVDAGGKLNLINDVELPPWSANSPSNFVIQLRKDLEKDNTSINKWFDIIFGYKQKGEKAEEAHNLFMGYSYQGMVKIDSIENVDNRNALLRLVEVGITPFQLFENECKPRIEKNQLLSKNNYFLNAKGVFLHESKKLSVDYINTPKYNRICDHFYQNANISSNKDYKIAIYPKILKIKWFDAEHINIFTNNNLYYTLKHTKPEEESGLFEIDNNSFKFSSSYLISNIDIPVIIYDNCKMMLKGGFWDGRIEINSLPFSEGGKDEKISTCVYPNKDDPILIMEMSKDEKNLLCGTKKGFIIGYSLNGHIFEIEQKIFLHTEEITSISINDNLNMFATASKDGCIMVHVLPTFNLVRTIKLNLAIKQKEGDKEELLYANNVFLSSWPLPCIVVYISCKRLFKTFSINGGPIYEINEIGNSRYLKSPVIYRDLNYQDYLIYGTNDGFVKIRKFPDMSLINNIELLDRQPIETLTISPDQRFCFAWSNGGKIAFIHDIEASINVEKEKKENKV